MGHRQWDGCIRGVLRLLSVVGEFNRVLTNASFKLAL